MRRALALLLLLLTRPAHAGPPATPQVLLAPPVPLAKAVSVTALAGADLRTLPVICYHRFGEEDDFDPLKISGKRFAQELAWLKKAGYHSISLAQARDFFEGKGDSLPAHPIILSIDDGYRSGWLAAGPVLKRYGFKAVYFLIASQVDAGRNFLNWQDVRDLLAAGNEVGCHTMHHSNLAKPARGESPEKYIARLNSEMLDSKALLEQKLGIKIRELAYPFGAYNPQVEDIALKAGYDLIFTVTSGVNLAWDSPHRIHRFIIMSHPSLASFIRKVEEKRLQARVAGIEEGTGFYPHQLPHSIVIKMPMDWDPKDPLRVGLQGEYMDAQHEQGTDTWSVTLDKGLKPSFYFFRVETGEEKNLRRDTYLFQVYHSGWIRWFEPFKELHADTKRP